MIDITYGIFAEDAANKIFIKNAIPQLVSHFGCEEEILFVHEEEFTDVMVAKSGQYLFENFIKTVAVGIKRFGLEVCFVGLDADDSNFLEIFQNMKKRLGANSLENNALIFIPVQAIEYWLWYLKEKNENLTISSTPIIDTAKARWEMKKLVYNRKKPANKYSNPIVEVLSQNIDFTWLKTHSASFNHFYSLFENYLNEKTAEGEVE